MEKLKRNLGITLVALIVTIIVLLILAGIAISQLTNSGLFNNVQTAKQEYANATSREDDILKQYENAISTGEVASNRDDSATITELRQEIEKLKNQVGGNPAGTVISYMASTAPTGYLVCDGQEVSRTTYSTLFSVIGTTYGEGDGSTTFNVPDLRGEFLRGTGKQGEDVGLHQNNGLPNITGYQNTYVDIGRSGNSGALYAKDDGADYVGTTTSGGTRYNRLSFDASKSNAIYGAAEEVRPTNTSVLYCIKF